jgi:hypothetical protein
MNCEGVRPLLSEQKHWPAEVSEHLSQCSACLDVLIEQAMSRWPSSDPPEDFVSRVYSVLPVEIAQPCFPRQWGVTCAILVVVILSVSLMLLDSSLLNFALDGIQTHSYLILGLLVCGSLELSGIVFAIVGLSSA